MLEGNEGEILGQRAAAVRQEIYGQAVFIRGLIEFTNYCKITAIIAVSVEATSWLNAIALRRKKFLPAVRKATDWAFALLYSRVERTNISQMLECVILFAVSRNSILIAL